METRLRKQVLATFAICLLSHFAESHARARPSEDGSESIMPIEEVSFAQVQDGLEAKTITLIDVRNRDELVNDGKIPGSENIPLPEFKSAFELSDEEFPVKYGFRKPKAADNVVITCRSGRRAGTALEQLSQLGYNSFKLYNGSFLDWVQNNGPLEKV